MSFLQDLLGSQIVQLVVLGAALLGAMSGILGSFAVLRQQSLLGDTLSHAALPGVCIGYLIAGERQLSLLLPGALVTGTLAALSVMLITKRTRLKTDAALGIALSVFFAIGTVLLTLIQAQGSVGSAGLSSFLFGQAAAITKGDISLMIGTGTLLLGVVLLFWKEFKLVSFDPASAQVLGLPVLALEGALTLIVAIAVVLGLQLVGVILMVALLIAPAAAARQWTRSLSSMVMLAGLLGAVAGAGGALVSATGRGLATGPVVVLIITGIVLISLLIAPQRGILWQARARRRLTKRLPAVTVPHDAKRRKFPIRGVKRG
ncbi:iron chelate uptake ABC transporter family permease subunit [Spiribacter sp. C176]|uniref:Iron chelate uptake ABC transporter family permease subunit n=1 Tax=Spiribacter salilacus TaxID=2664894 RepID=A0A6N7QQJ0_9GAMM|nr:iron chelate uptake ABC transporter family permease subunit [Spiribacter salilacus]MRH78691.1 iron chelate uptake ABC transporter family permease subunit [Spiribacter salilacus]